MAASEHRNVVLMVSDQLRADCVGCYGNSTIRTPNIDALAENGTRFAETFAQHPQCNPSRAAINSGRYPHVNGAISNYAAIGEHETTLPEYFREAGYRTIATGKYHQFGEKERAFTDTMMSGGQRSSATNPEVLREDYKQWLKENGHWDVVEEAYAYHGTDEYIENFRGTVNPIPAEAYVDSWVGDRAVEYIREQPDDEPFYLFAGFPNPHVPFDAPEPYASMYDPAEVPIPETFGESLDDKPPQHARYKKQGRTENYEHLTEEKLRRCIAYYYGSITLVDDQVGKVMRALREEGKLDDTVVVFISDHGELLGEFGMLIKSTDAYPMLYDAGLQVPCIVQTPAHGSDGREPGRTVEEPIELVDVCPTILETAGLDVSPVIQGESLAPAMSGGQVPKRRYVFAETGAVKMIRGDRYKLVHYPRQSYGELYDVVADPKETTNLYDDPEFEEVRTRMTRDLLDRLISTEGPIHGETHGDRGPAYWREMYQVPFESGPE